MKPIETQYKGYRFRSRLEARWAVFFDALGIEWEYEPEGFVLDDGTMYLPDFWFPQFGCYGEVKPSIFTREEYDKCDMLDRRCLLLDGTPRVDRAYYVTGSDGPEDTYEYYSNPDDTYYGFVHLSMSAGKGRLWFLLGENISDYWVDDKPEKAARSARFEHGEHGEYYGSVWAS